MILSPRPPSISIFIGHKIFQLLIQHMKMYIIDASVNMTVCFFSFLKGYTLMIEKVNHLSVELSQIGYYLTTTHRGTLVIWLGYSSNIVCVIRGYIE